MPFSVQAVHHVGLAVSDIERSRRWYAEMFGLEPGPVDRGEGEELARSVQVPGAVLSFSMIRIGSTRIEFLEYHEPDGKPFDRSNADIGSAHICLEVDDIDAAIADLTARGVEFSGPPVTLTDGSLQGCRWAYFRDPDGIQLELWETAA
ncbi:VOC family protein [Cnuibacter physcomitrellae]|uniref:VOC family protein n=1 Tax=Cnuibacter physcomitrellae TaxID=1619308 RepID=UPI00217588AD|nr:VOC family protein [Cnuibacter physcomitrellae]MCS5497847.1 VOC family protein [Cnuibacter physcomitrellae]